MFGRKKTKLGVSLPKPPTKAEILEDLGTFCMDQTQHDAAKRRSSTAAAAASTGESPKAAGIEHNVHLERWWNNFEAFLDELDDLKNYQEQFDVKRKNLEELDNTIRVLSQDVRAQIGRSVQSALDEAADNSSNSK